MVVGIYHQADVKLAEFRSLHEVSRVSSLTDELWYNDTVIKCVIKNIKCLYSIKQKNLT